jgi:hypothetical protein
MKTVILFGAGATKACGGPLTNEILPQAFKQKVQRQIDVEAFIPLLRDFLVENFHLPQSDEANRTVPDSDYPALPLLISEIDMAIARKKSMGSYSVDRLLDVRRALQYMIFALLEYKLRHLTHNYYFDLFEMLDPNPSDPPTVISLNYDIIADNAMRRHNNRCLPNYGCEISSERYQSKPHKGTLLKIHGSLNWSYCPTCPRLDLAISELGRTRKMPNELYQRGSLEDRYSRHGFACPKCHTSMEPILIAPSQLKNYSNTYVEKIWMLAEKALLEAEHVIIIGYSLPDDDQKVISLLKRCLGHLAKSAPQNITVVEKTDEAQAIGENLVGRRYRSIFGPDIDWRTDGFEGLIKSIREGQYPIAGPGAPVSC